MTVGQIIKKYLDENKITQKEFAINVGMEPPKLNLILNGHRRLQLEEYATFCDVLGVPYDTFLKKLKLKKGA